MIFRYDKGDFMSVISWAVWLAAGLILMGIEIVMPGFVIFWFGIGGIITALLTKLSLLNSPETQWFVFFVSSLAFLASWFLYFKRFIKKTDTEDARDPTLLNLRGKVIQKIAPGAPGRVELNDSYHGLKEWKAESDTDLETGAEIKVIESRGINLVVKKI